MTLRKIIHIDMDAFYASVEQRDRPELRGKPVIVGGSPNTRSVVCTASYEARKYGIHSAMPSSRAYKLCPHAVFIRPEFKKYREISSQFQQYFKDVTPIVEPLSLDEAYLDVTENNKAATHIAKALCSKIHEELKLTASAGVSFNKFLAKIASDVNKPNGIAVIRPKSAQRFVDALPVKRFHGIGEASAHKLYKLGIYNGRDLRLMPRDKLVNTIGKSGGYFHDLANLIDERPVNSTRVSKSVGSEKTFEADVSAKDEIVQELIEQAEVAWHGLIRKNLFAKTLTIKIKFNDFRQITRSQTFSSSIRSLYACIPWIEQLTQSALSDESAPVRLVGVTFSSFKEAKYTQLELPI